MVQVWLHVEMCQFIAPGQVKKEAPKIVEMLDKLQLGCNLYEFSRSHERTEKTVFEAFVVDVLGRDIVCIGPV